MRRLLTVAAVLGASISAGAEGATSGSPYIGTWTGHLTTAQMINRGLDARLAGSFRLVLRPNRTYTTFNSFDGASRGRYRVAGRKIVFSRDVGCTAGGFEGDGSYRWSVTRGVLRLTQVVLGSDPCGGRWQTLTYPTWRRK